MATTSTSICNSALIKIGAERIASLTENNKRAIACNEQYEKLRDEVLSAHPWSFAKARVQLALDVATPAFEFSYQFVLPTDCLGVLKTSNGDDKFKIEGGRLLTNDSTCLIQYIQQVTDTSKYSPTFCEALACRIAADLAYMIAQSNSLQQAMMTAYKAQLAQARNVNAQQGSQDQLTAHDWLRSRF